MRKIVTENNVVTNILTVPDSWTGAPGEWQPRNNQVVRDFQEDVDLGYVWNGSSYDDPNAKTPSEVEAELDAKATELASAAFEKSMSVDRALARALFTVVNEVRVLKGQQEITAQQFKDYLKGFIR